MHISRSSLKGFELILSQIYILVLEELLLLIFSLKTNLSLTKPGEVAVSEAELIITFSSKILCRSPNIRRKIFCLIGIISSWPIGSATPLAN